MIKHINTQSNGHNCEKIRGYVTYGLRLTVVAPIVEQLVLIQVDNVRAYIVQKRLIMGNNQQCLLPTLQIATGGEESVNISAATNETSRKRTLLNTCSGHTHLSSQMTAFKSK